jgi:hypothetical protein
MAFTRNKSDFKNIIELIVSLQYVTSNLQV